MPETCSGIFALFDEATNNIFIELNRSLKEAKIRRIDIPPHITLGIYNADLQDELHEWLMEVCKNQNRIKINFNHIGLFGESVLFLAPQVNKEILSMHEKLHAKYDDNNNELGYHYTLKSGEFVPHASLVVNDKEQVLQAVSVISKKFKPFRAEIVSLCLCTFYPFRVLHNFELK